MSDLTAYKDTKCSKYCADIPSKKVCIDPVSAISCKDNIKKCDKNICGEVTTYSKFTTCIKFEE